jgi:hypothetical protein
MTSAELTNHWLNVIPNFLITPSELKIEFKERWFRVHTLPNSKRYADNENEYNEILRRHNEILTDLFGLNHPFILLTFSYGKYQKPKRDKKLQKINIQKNYWLSCQIENDENFKPFYWHIFFDEKEWETNSLNLLFRLIADDEVSNVMLFSPDRRIVYHPYDGGADIIFEKPDLKDFYLEKYKDWLSVHPSGL